MNSGFMGKDNGEEIYYGTGVENGVGVRNGGKDGTTVTEQR